MAKVRKARFVFADGTSGVYRVAYNLEQCIIAQKEGTHKLVIINKAFIASRA